MAILRQDDNHRSRGGGIAVGKFGLELYGRDALRLGRQILLRGPNRPHEAVSICGKGAACLEECVDLILVDRDPLTCSEDGLKTTEVLWTMVGGKVVYQAR